MRNSELNAKNTSLQSTILMQETKIKELENTIRILNRKIVVLEDTESEYKRTDANSPVQNCCHRNSVTATDNLLLAMREKVHTAESGCSNKPTRKRTNTCTVNRNK
ncbi:Hypothetical predicted protein [Mytilus galloprovincialis]|uniref:Uncharacterized protein n=1 Tax=Mytilus galloprovincialis TaxID=29158 RepID=A0A8B6C617_MYTGA|nr:Hypothetical predicted protein [Mytilus galloprovincialis]